jgi:intracellular sulfur oxidation DsrE/DsrF family protein
MIRILPSLAALVLSAGMAVAQGQVHKIAVQVDQNDPAVMNLALNNVENLLSVYKAEGDTAMIDVVAYGPGLMMYVKDQSPVADRISVIALEHPEVNFDACNNTLKGMEKKAGHPIPLIDEAKVVPSGAAKLVELQEQGYTYLKP